MISNIRVINFKYLYCYLSNIMIKIVMRWAQELSRGRKDNIVSSRPELAAVGWQSSAMRWGGRLGVGAGPDRTVRLNWGWCGWEQTVKLVVVRQCIWLGARAGWQGE